MNEIYKLQARGGRVAVVEHPNTSVAWNTKALNELDGYVVTTDMCAYGAILPDHGGKSGSYQGTYSTQDDSREGSRSSFAKMRWSTPTC